MEDLRRGTRFRIPSDSRGDALARVEWISLVDDTICHFPRKYMAANDDFGFGYVVISIASEFSRLFGASIR